MFKRYLILSVFGIGIGFAILFSINRFSQPEGEVIQDFAPLGIADIGGDFTLTDHNGNKRSTTEFRGKLLLIYFGYTYCPDICPMALENITNALKNMSQDRDKIAVIFVSVDPERDTLETLKLYHSNFDPNIIMMTGTQKELEEPMKNYKVYSKREAKHGMSDYLINHTSVVYLMNKNGQYVQGFAHSTKPKKIKEILVKNLTTRQKN